MKNRSLGGRMLRIGLALGVFGAAVPAAAQTAPKRGLADERRARAVLEGSKLSLRGGGGDCRLLAKHYRTLGALASSHRKKANVEKSVRCARSAGGWDCKASFIYKDKEMSEKDWGLKLRFRVEAESSAVSELECFLAG